MGYKTLDITITIAGIDFPGKIHYDASKGEAKTWHYPGSDPSIDISDIEIVDSTLSDEVFRCIMAHKPFEDSQITHLQLTGEDLLEETIMEDLVEQEKDYEMARAENYLDWKEDRQMAKKREITLTDYQGDVVTTSIFDNDDGFSMLFKFPILVNLGEISSRIIEEKEE